MGTEWPLDTIREFGMYASGFWAGVGVLSKLIPNFDFGIYEWILTLCAFLHFSPEIATHVFGFLRPGKDVNNGTIDRLGEIAFPPFMIWPATYVLMMLFTPLEEMNFPLNEIFTLVIFWCLLLE